MSIIQKFDYETLVDYEKQKKLKHGKHPIYDLHIWNYAEAVQFSKSWDTITENCRGLITDSSGEIIARSFPKFFNLEELGPEKVKDWIKFPYSVYEKMDGSLGILFFYEKEKTWIFASRGSFTSEQSQEAMKMLTQNHPNFHQELDSHISYVFEIIYPDNQIVVNYGNRRELVLLGLFNNHTGEEIPLTAEKRMAFEKDGYKVVQEIPSKDFAALKADNLANQEGYVVKFHTFPVQERMKIKFETYILLHRAVSNISVKRLFDLCQEGSKFEEIVLHLPDEFHHWCSQVHQAITGKYQEINQTCQREYQQYYHADRPTFARSIQSHAMKSVLFSFYSQHPEEKIRNYIFEKVLTVEEFEVQFPSKGEMRGATAVGEEQREEEEEVAAVEEKAVKSEKTIQKSLEMQKSSANTTKPVVGGLGKIGSGFSPKKQSSAKPYAIILIGVSGSGKSTWVKSHLADQPHYLVISRDQLRHQLYRLDTEKDLQNYYNLCKTNPNEFNKKEMFISSMQESMVQCASQQKKNIILDNTHLKLKFIKDAVKLIGEKANIFLKSFEPLGSVEEHIERIRRRSYNNSMTADIIEKQIEDYRTLFQNFSSAQDLLAHIQSAPEIQPIVQNPSLPPCYIFDIDGTLALNTSGRSYYDMSRVDEDTPCPPVVQMLHNLRKCQFKIIICTGRNAYASKKTEEWLRKYQIPFDEIHYRPDNDSEKDCYVKERMWKDICQRYHICAMYDDRNQVVNYARQLGFMVFQVAENAN
jgi:RNA ligase